MENTENKNSKMIWVVPVILGILVIGYFVFGGNKGLSLGNVGTNNQASVATVNGTAIPKATYDTQLASVLASYKTQGVDVTDATKLSQIKTQVLDNLINDEVLNQAVAVAGIKSDPAEVEKQYQAIVTSAGGADKFQAELTKNNLTEATLRENITKQLMIQAYLLQNIDVKSVTVSDAEIAQFYNDYVKAQKDAGQTKLPALKDVSEQIKQQITVSKQNTLVNDFIKTLRAKAEVKMSVE